MSTKESGNGFGKILEFTAKLSPSVEHKAAGAPAPITNIDEARRKKEIMQASTEELKKRAREVLVSINVPSEVRDISKKINELMEKTKIHDLKQAVQEILLNPNMVQKDPLVAKAVLHAFILFKS